MAKRKLDQEYLQRLQEALDAHVACGGSMQRASKRLDIARTTLNDRVDRAWAEGLHPSPEAMAEGGIKPPKVPMSESEDRFRPDWTAEDCAAELVRIAKMHPTQVISRNHFRVHGACSESTWTQFFGTFHEFKRQAGITPSRHVHAHERHIAKHASRDRMRALSAEKQAYEGQWDRPSDKRWQMIAVCSDVHDQERDPFWEHVWIDTIRRAQPDRVVIGGDLFDLPEFSKHTIDPREWDVVGRIRSAHAFLGACRDACPNAELWLIEGNHEFRLLRHIAEASPAMRAVLSDLHNMTVPMLLGLDQFEMNYMARMDLTAWTEADIRKQMQRNWIIFDDAFVVHHFPQGRNMGYPGVNGHHHKHIVWPGFNPASGSHEWHQLGCGHKRAATYVDADHWSNGFALAHVDTVSKSVAVDYVDVKPEHACSGGKYYFRKEVIDE